MKLLAWLFATYLFFFAVAYGVATSQERIRFNRPPAVVWDTYVVTYWVHVPLNSRNRYVDLAAYDGDFRVQGTRINLEREARRTLWDQAKWRLPAGEIYLVAVLVGVREDGQVAELARAVHQVTVVSGGF